MEKEYLKGNKKSNGVWKNIKPGIWEIVHFSSGFCWLLTISLLGKSVCLSGPQFSHPWNGNDISPTSKRCWHVLDRKACWLLPKMSQIVPRMLITDPLPSLESQGISRRHPDRKEAPSPQGLTGLGSSQPLFLKDTRAQRKTFCLFGLDLPPA